MNYEDKDSSSITILNQCNEETLNLCQDDWKKIALIKSHPPSFDQGKNTQGYKVIVDLELRMRNFQTRSLVLMWDKRKGKPNM
jgi:hypothetical protein